MRTLNKNTTKLWLVRKATQTEEVDSDGFLTGQMITTFGTPSIVYLNIIAYTGEIVEQIFGKDASLDMVAVSNNVVLEKEDLLFLTEPVSEYSKTYDYRIHEIKKSINTYQYGLRCRT